MIRYGKVKIHKTHSCIFRHSCTFFSKPQTNTEGSKETIRYGKVKIHKMHYCIFFAKKGTILVLAVLRMIRLVLCQIGFWYIGHRVLYSYIFDAIVHFMYLYFTITYHSSVFYYHPVLS